MQTPTILIIEDDLLMARGLQQQLNELGYDNHHWAKDPSTALKHADDPDIKLAFVDIQLGDKGTAGIPLARQLDQTYHIPVVFITSFSDDQILKQANQVAYFDYLVKPVKTTQLKACIHKIFQSPKFSADYPKPLMPPDRFFVKGLTRLYDSIFVSDFIYLRSKDRKLFFYLQSQSEYLKVTYLSILGFLSQFQHPDIMRVHRSYVVNLKHVVARDDAFLKMSNGDTIPFTRNYSAEVDNRLKMIRNA